jgi:recombination protein RecR
MSISAIEQLIQQFSKLPGLGSRSARRVVLHLIRNKDKLVAPLTQSLQSVAESIRTCAVCGNLDSADPCDICTDPRRDPLAICVVEDIADVWAIERSHTFRGRYHVLGGTLSALDGRGPDALNFASLLQRVKMHGITEVIIATNATVDGQTTAHYITDMLAPCNITISRLAQGIPFGGELDYLDDGTLNAAFKSRLPF